MDDTWIPDNLPTQLDAARRRLASLRQKLATCGPNAKDYYARVVRLWEIEVERLEQQHAQAIYMEEMERRQS